MGGGNQFLNKYSDIVLAVVRRTWRGEELGKADKEHLHHRLLDVGHTQRRAVLLMYLWSALISGSALAVGLINGRLAVGLIVLAAGLLILITALPRLTREPGRHGPPPPPGPAVKTKAGSGAEGP